MNIDINELFDQLNEEHFENKIPKIPVQWNNRLRTTAGRCHIERFNYDFEPTKIDLANRLFENNQWDLNKVKRTLIHEMTHAYCVHLYNNKSHDWQFQAIMTRITKEWKDHTYHNYNTNGLKEKRNIEIICPTHGIIGYRTRMPRKGRTYIHSGCGHEVIYHRPEVVMKKPVRTLDQVLKSTTFNPFE
jgi:predicted SprT family Zn-dependent metalloprotease